MDVDSLCVFVPNAGSNTGLLFSMSGYYNCRMKAIVSVKPQRAFLTV